MPKAFVWTTEGSLPRSPNQARIVFAHHRDPVASGKRGRFRIEIGGVASLITATGGGWSDPYELPV